MGKFAFVVMFMISSQIRAQEIVLENHNKYTFENDYDTVKHSNSHVLSDGYTPGFASRIYLKTNAIEWAMLIKNIAIELDLNRQWSLSLTVSFSHTKQLSSSTKFQIFSVRPEIRYWISDINNDKWFFGAHFGLTYYNFAYGGDWRYQSISPALGGGASVGYRMPFRENSKWKLEFLLGAGVYKVNYHKFHNYKNGSLIGAFKETYFGIDNAAVSLSYMFKIKK